MNRGLLLAFATLIFCAFYEAMLIRAPLYFRYGAVSSAKSLNLLAVANSYKVQGKQAILMKVRTVFRICVIKMIYVWKSILFLWTQPSIDSRFGKDEIRSRAGLSQKADFVLDSSTNILDLPLPKTTVHCVLVDEAQFLQTEQVNQLRLATEHWNIPIFCYGLRTDFRSNFFSGSKRLMEVADVIEEISTCCHYCTSKAILNLKHVNGVADASGPTVQLGAEEKYYPTCFECYRNSLVSVKQSPVECWNHQIIRKTRPE